MEWNWEEPPKRLQVSWSASRMASICYSRARVGERAHLHPTSLGFMTYQEITTHSLETPGVGAQICLSHLMLAYPIKKVPLCLIGFMTARIMLHDDEWFQLEPHYFGFVAHTSITPVSLFANMEKWNVNFFLGGGSLTHFKIKRFGFIIVLPRN